MFTFPVQTESLLEWIPHRPPMVWVDEVTRVDEAEGICATYFDRHADFWKGPSIRASALIEWLAQSYAFVGICQSFVFQHGSPRIKSAYLAAVSNGKWQDGWENWLAVDRGARIFVRRTHTVGPISLIEGKVEGAQSGRIYFTAHLKVYSEVL